MAVIIRWMGAFNKKFSLQESLEWELTQTSIKALPAEKLVSGKSSKPIAK